ncbi:helix-turn-helix transcriptional regulator [Kitasatospora brasiliensis]|uniref:helix-turn-helix transcriptional regulator n=1 Tax=Kitasatospora brasiliensis TaxID=3058040 RepID=UPI0029312D5C|nr:hypothetical protein [Kitasatospora sp. K002]
MTALSAKREAVHGRACPLCGARVSVSAVLHEVLCLMASGASNAQIGGGRGEARGGYLVRRVLACLGASRRAHAVDLACRLGLVDMPAEVRPPYQGIPPHLRASAVLLASGLSYREAAERQGRSPSAVRADRHLLYGRLGASGGAHAVYLLHALQKLPAGHPCVCLKSPGRNSPEKQWCPPPRRVHGGDAGR